MELTDGFDFGQHLHGLDEPEQLWSWFNLAAGLRGPIKRENGSTSITEIYRRAEPEEILAEQQRDEIANDIHVLLPVGSNFAARVLVEYEIDPKPLLQIRYLIRQDEPSGQPIGVPHELWAEALATVESLFMRLTKAKTPIQDYVSKRQAKLLLHHLENGGGKMLLFDADVAVVLDVSRSTACRHSKRLESLGYLETAGKGRRLTDKGREFAAELDAE